MDIIHTEITFRDTFSFTTLKKVTTLSEYTFNKIRANDIGKVVPFFDKITSIHYNYEIISIEQFNPHTTK